jgi:two-component sensor histidine kinase
LADAYRFKKDFSLATFHAKTAVEIAKTLNDNHRLFNSYNALFQVNESSGDYKAAFENLKIAKSYEDSTLKIEKLRSIADVETKYQTAKKEGEIAVLGEKNKAQQKSLWLLMAGLVVTIGFIGAIYLQNKKLNESRQQISAQADQLKLMMKELHHRVKNNLAIVSGLLRIQSNKLEDEAAIQAVRQGQQRVDAMSLIHQRLYQTDKVTTINIKEYIIDLAESLMSAYGFEPNKFDLTIAVEKEELDVDLAIPLGLIINELLTNSFKYAYQNIEKPALNISLKGDKNLDLEIKDNGIGIDLNRWKTAKDSFGKKLISGLVNQIGGKFTIENDKGTVFRMALRSAS